MKSDIEIARSVELKKIKQVAEGIGIPREEVENYGRYIAKIPEQLIDEEKVKKSNLVLVTAITATKAGIGKTTVSIGLALGLNKIGKKAIVALREPSLGPCFGMKGGAAGGGYAQVLLASGARRERPFIAQHRSRTRTEVERYHTGVRFRYYSGFGDYGDSLSFQGRGRFTSPHREYSSGLYIR